MSGRCQWNASVARFDCVPNDYRQAGSYFLTLCTHERACLFGEVVDGAMRLSDCGRLVEEAWQQTERVRPNVAIDAFVVMPNHLHGIIFVLDSDERPLTAGPPPGLRSPAQTIGAIVRGFKASVTRQIGGPIWQRNYYEHVVRDQRDLERIRRYIEENPAAWASDAENPVARGR